MTYCSSHVENTRRVKIYMYVNDIKFPFYSHRIIVIQTYYFNNSIETDKNKR